MGQGVITTAIWEEVRERKKERDYHDQELFLHQEPDTPNLDFVPILVEGTVA